MGEEFGVRLEITKLNPPNYDVAHALVFLASEKVKYITGIVLNTSGEVELFTF